MNQGPQNLSQRLSQTQPKIEGNARVYKEFGCSSTPAPTPPVSVSDDCNSVVGAGLLVRYAAHIAELIKHTSSIQTNIKNPHLQHIEHGIELCGLNVTLLGSSFEKILSPGKITFAGDIRRDE